MNKKQVCVACGGKLQRWFSKEQYWYWRCFSCNSVATTPLPSDSAISAHYAQKFKTGNYLLAREFATEYLTVYKQFAKIIEATLQLKNQKIKDAKLLDVGCFTGDFLEVMAHKGAQVYGTELQPAAIKIASKKFPRHIFQADIGTKNFPHKKFSIVTLLGLIEHVTSPQALLNSVDKVIQPGGLLVIQTPNSTSGLAKILGKWWPPLAPVEHIHVFSEKGVITMLQKHGYTHIKVTAHYKWLPVKYVYYQLKNFGPHFYKLLKPFGVVLQRIPAGFVLPFYGGEMIITAYKKAR